MKQYGDSTEVDRRIRDRKALGSNPVRRGVAAECSSPVNFPCFYFGIRSTPVLPQ